MARIKICRVIDLDTIRALAALGVDYIGIHLVATPTEDKLRHLSALLACCRTYQPTTQPVLVTKNLTLAELLAAVGRLQPPLVQLHDPWTPEDLSVFRSGILSSIKIIVAVDPISGANQWVNEQPDLADFVLLDRIQGGTGKALPIDHVRTAMRRYAQFPVFLAGGLNADNVGATIAEHRPFSVDVQSSLEVPGFKGRKDIVKTIGFLRSVRSRPGSLVNIQNPHPVLCLSLTDFPVNEIRCFDAGVMAAIDVAHLDHADGSVDIRFVRDSSKHAEELHQNFPLQPYELHLFLSPLNPESVRTTLTTYLSANPFLRAIICYLDPLEPVTTSWSLDKCREVAHVFGVGFAVCLQARELTPTTMQNVMQLLAEVPFDFLSVVGPPEKASPEIYASIVGPFISYLQNQFGSNARILVDRSITVSRLRALNNAKLNGAVGGKSIWATTRPLETIKQFRETLTHPATTHGSNR